MSDAASEMEALHASAHTARQGRKTRLKVVRPAEQEPASEEAPAPQEAESCSVQPSLSENPELSRHKNNGNQMEVPMSRIANFIDKTLAYSDLVIGRVSVDLLVPGAVGGGAAVGISKLTTRIPNKYLVPVLVLSAIATKQVVQRVAAKRVEVPTATRLQMQASSAWIQKAVEAGMSADRIAEILSDMAPAPQVKNEEAAAS